MNMKTLRISLLLLLLSCLIGYGETDVQFSFANGQYNISQYTNVTVMLQPEQMNVSGFTTLLPGAIYQTTDTNASTTFSNLYGSYSGGYYHWRVISFSNPSGTGPIPAQGNQGDIQVTATNLGLINSTALGIVFVPVYSGSGAANTVQASDLRYAPIGGIIATNISNSTGTNVIASGSFIGSYSYPHGDPMVGVDQTSGFEYLYSPDGFSLRQSSIDSEISSVGATLFDPLGAASAATNGLVGASITNGLASTNYVNAATSGLVTTNFVLSSITATNLANLTITTNLITAATNNLVTASITNGLATTNYVNAATSGLVTNSNILFSGSIYHNTNLIFSFNDTNGAILIGPLAKFSGQLDVDIHESPVAIGYNTAVTRYGVAIGAGAVSAGLQGVALGASSQSTGNRGIAIGWSSVAAGGQDIAIGDEVNALGGQGVGIGFANQVGANSTAVGAYTTASGNSSQALGYNLYVTGSHSTGLGSGFTLARDYAFAWSDNNKCPATTNNQVAFYASNGYLFAGGPIAGNGSGLTNLQSSNIVTTTNAAPTGITWGVTVPDYWIKLTNSSTVGYVWMPCWTNH